MNNQIAVKQMSVSLVKVSLTVFLAQIIAIVRFQW